MNKLKTALTHIRRTPYQALAAVILSTITFFVVTTFTLLVLGTNETLQYLQSQPQVTAFFKDNTTNQQINSLRSKIEDSGLAKEITFISKQEALEIYKEQNKDNPLLLEMVTADILPASLEVSARNVEDLESIAEIMQQEQTVEEVIYQKDIINTLKKWTNGIRIAGITLSAIFLFASIMTITVIIGLKTASRKDEIDTLSLLGATNWYIKGPFVYEGVFYSTLGAFLGWGITSLALLYLTPNLQEFLSSIPLLPVPIETLLIILGAQLLMGILVGAIASLFATRRYGR